MSRTVPEELLSAYLDEEVTPDERAAVESALAASSESRARLEELAETRRAVRELPRPEGSAEFWDSLAVRVPATPSARRATGSTTRSRGRRLTLLAGAAAAAVIVAALVVPGSDRVNPRVRAKVQAHAVRASVSSDPVSELAPVAAGVGVGK